MGKENQQLVSIGLPVYNGERFIRKALDALLAQDYEHIELIISDNASTDQTEAICRSYAATDNRIRYYRNEANLGVEKNFQRVLELSSGRYFMWAAHDDLWESSFVSKLMRPFQINDEVVLSCCNYDTIYHQKSEFVPHGNPLPPLSARNTIFENTLSMLNTSHSPFFYGIFKAEAVKRAPTLWRKKSFDFSDLAILNEVSLQGKVHLNPELLFHAGVKNLERAPTAFARRRLPGFKFAYGRYYLATMRSILRATSLQRKEKAQLLQALTNQVLGLISGHERIPGIFRKAISLELYYSGILADKFFPLPKRQTE